MHHHFQIARLYFFHAAIKYDAAAVDEHHIGEDVLDLFHLMCGHDDGAAAVEVVVQQGIVELLAIQDIAAERPQFSLIWGEAEDCVERGGLARAVGTDEPENAALFNTQINAVQRDGCAEGLTEAAGFYAGHGVSFPPWGNLTWRFSTGRCPKMTGGLRRSVAHPASGRGAEWWRGPEAILRQGTSAVRPAAKDCARRR